MTNDLRLIPARKSAAARLAAGQRVRLVNTHGTQVVDCWAFTAADTREFMSMEHTRVELQRSSPAVGDSLFTNRRRPILTLVEDSSPGVHDTTLAACDIYRYQRLGYRGQHDNCTDNLRHAMAESGFNLPSVPCPLNFWENAPILPDRSQRIEPPVSTPGDQVILRAELDLVIVFSACPQDLVPTNGAAAIPMDAHFAIESGPVRNTSNTGNTCNGESVIGWIFGARLPEDPPNQGCAFAVTTALLAAEAQAVGRDLRGDPGPR
jgi:uncharacterized protein